jgi:hypothetical protein
MRLITRLLAFGIACIILPLAMSCGSMMTVGMSLNGNDPFWDSGASHYDGVWWGKYVWYHGDWHYLGYGTPYFYDPTNYYWR